MAQALDKKYEMMRQIAEQKSRAGQQEQEDALKRRFAATGSLSSGAALKTLGSLKQQQAQQLEQSGKEIDIAKLGEQQRLEEIESGRLFSKSEREASQLFGSGEAEKQRLFGRGEREAGQKFGSEQAELQRKYATSERVAGQKYATSERVAGQKYATAERLAQQGFSENMWQKEQQWQDAMFTENARMQMEQFASQNELAWKQYGLDERVSMFNMGMAEADFNKPGLTDIITNPFGFFKYQQQQAGATYRQFKRGGAKSFFG